MPKKIQKVVDVKESILLTAENQAGAISDRPETAMPGNYPEFGKVDLPEHLRKRSWDLD